MPVSIIVGGQFGSEGKGKTAKVWAERMDATIAVRCGGPNSGHTVVTESGKFFIFRQIPTPSIIRGVTAVLCAGTYINLDVLQDEIRIADLTRNNLFIDPNAIIITNKMREKEAETTIRTSTGSTLSGTGEAVSSRINRIPDLLRAEKVEWLKPYIRDTKDYLRSALKAGERLIIEGTQGYGLSVLHSDLYPFTTSRDTTASGFLSECGLSPLDVDEVVLVLRSFPIRVSGNSGDLPNEISWDTLTKESGSPKPLIEYTSATNRIRRIARFGEKVVKQAIVANNPTHIVMNHLDYIDWGCRDGVISNEIISFVENVEGTIERKVDLIGTNPINLKGIS